MKSIAILQPVYLPWLGYFEQIAVCDEFMFLDDVKYTKYDWRNRNKIRTAQGWQWLIVPVEHRCADQTLRDTLLGTDGRRMLSKQRRALIHNYRQAPYFDDIFAILEPALTDPPTRLLDLTAPLVAKLAAYLDITTPIGFSSDLKRTATGRQPRIVELCRGRSAQVLYTGPSAKAYMDLAYFESENVRVIFQQYVHPVYPQRYPGFESHMSVVDLLMNHGPRSREILLSSPRPPGLPASSGKHCV